MSDRTQETGGKRYHPTIDLVDGVEEVTMLEDDRGYWYARPYVEKLESDLRGVLRSQEADRENVAQVEQQRVAMSQDNNRLEKALRKYGEHQDPLCEDSRWNDGPTCVCGFRALVPFTEEELDELNIRDRVEAEEVDPKPPEE